jgi:hypothetical protein
MRLQGGFLGLALLPSQMFFLNDTENQVKFSCLNGALFCSTLSKKVSERSSCEIFVEPHLAASKFEMA